MRPRADASDLAAELFANARIIPLGPPISLVERRSVKIQGSLSFQCASIRELIVQTSFLYHQNHVRNLSPSYARRQVRWPDGVSLYRRRSLFGFAPDP